MGLLFLLSRFIYGGYFLWNGYKHLKNSDALAGYAAMHKVPKPKLAVIGSGLLLIIGGAGIVLGAFIPVAVAALVLFLVPVTLTMHAYWKEGDPMARMTAQIMFAKNVALLGAALAYLFIPMPWLLSI